MFFRVAILIKSLQENIVNKTNKQTRKAQNTFQKYLDRQVFSTLAKATPSSENHWVKMGFMGKKGKKNIVH